MSASLVGSEMCIRDRPPPATAPLSPYARKHCHRHLPIRSTQACAVAAPVSYTHLTLPTICSV
eukprot:6441657-Alexandrium_andersonii.AAC.1